MKDKMEKQIQKESIFGIVPVMKNEKVYGFLNAFLILSGYGVATWCYTQGAYVASFISFKQLLASTFSSHLIVLAILVLPVIFAARYGIDIWIWLKSIFGTRGIKVISVVIILINFPWYAVCADIFASAMTNMLAGFGITITSAWHPWMGVLCVALGTLLAIKGPVAITWVTRFMVPLLLAVGAYVVYVAFTAVPITDMWNFRPEAVSMDSYVKSIEGNLGFAMTWFGTVAVMARMCKKESQAYWSTTLSFGVVTPFFIFAGGVMAIAMFLRTGVYVDDPTLMLATLGGPYAALLSLILVAFANIGTQGVGSYLYGVMLKAPFPRASYNWLVIILGVYAGGLTLWGRVVEFFGAFLSFGAFIYAPVWSMLFVDFFFVRKQKLSFRSAYEFEGYKAYEYKKGFNPVGFFCLIAGMIVPMLIYNPVTGEIHSKIFYYLTATGVSLIVTGSLYYLLSRIPKIRNYILQDRNELTVDNKAS